MSQALVRLDKDYSGRGMRILADKVQMAFKKKLPEAKLWMTDIYDWPEFKNTGPVDVVFFGDFFRKFLETGNWTYSEYRFWCLGSPTKKFLIQQAGFREDQVSIIPRSLLYKSIVNQEPFNLKEQQIELVYSGRLTSSKRILTMLWSVYFLQKKHDLNFQFSLYGDFLMEEKFCECPGVNPYKSKVLELLECLDWNVKPVWKGLVRPEEWTENHSLLPVYFSLSVLPFEDFSVSIAQVQEKGWPCILSKWGAHNDLGGQLLKVPLQLFENINETIESSKREGESVAQYVFSKPFKNVEIPTGKFKAPDIVTMEEIDLKRRGFLAKWGMKFQDVIRHRTDDLKEDPSWGSFMKEYLKNFT